MVHRTANPTYTVEELVYQLKFVKARLLIVHPSVLSVASAAARAVGLPPDRIVLFVPEAGTSHANLPEVIRAGLDAPQQFTELRLEPGEAKKKLALLSFSSGTTGPPKAVMISHYSIIANLVQLAQRANLNDESVPMEQKRYRPGSIVLGGASWCRLDVLRD